MQIVSNVVSLTTDVRMMVWLCSALKLHALSQTLFEDSTDTNNGSLVCTDIKRAIL